MKKVRHARKQIEGERKRTMLGGRAARGLMAGKGRGHLNKKSNVPLLPSGKEKSTYKAAFDLARKGGALDETANLLEQAHKQGDGRATYALATWYIHGLFYKRNPLKAIRLLRSATKKGIREAAFDLAYAHESGFGVEKHLEKAFDLYVTAAQKGDAQAVEAVVRHLYQGIGVAKHRELAFLVAMLASKKT